MKLRFLRAGVAGLAVFFAAAVHLGAAQAGQTFICADGTSVSVELKDLERAKRENACVGAYFMKPAKPNASPENAATAGLSGPALKPRIAETVRKPEQQQVADFRNVPIINAPGGKVTYYRHTR